MTTKRMTIDASDMIPRRSRRHGSEMRIPLRYYVFLVLSALPGCGDRSKEKAILLAGLSGPSEEGRYFFAYDELIPPGRAALMTAQVEAYRGKKTITGHTVTFYRDGEVLGQAVTDVEGKAVLRWLPPGKGEYLLSARLTAVASKKDDEILEIEPVSLLVCVRPAESPLAVVDLDRTLLDAGILSALIGRGDPMPGSQRVMRRLARRYGIVYLTHRPVGMSSVSKTWLRKHAYPAGPVLLSQAEQTVEDSRHYKTQRLESLKEDFPNLALGIGDKFEDIQAYRSAGMAAYWLRPYRRRARNMRALAESLRPITDAGVYAVANWNEIETGVFAGRRLTCPPYADRLDREADEFSPR
jgi:hypothetical protein